MRTSIPLATLVLVLGSEAIAQTTQHYIFFEFDRHRIHEIGFLEHPMIEGAQLKYSWRELESGPGEYDFSSVESDLEFLEAHGKRLFVQLQDVSFVNTIVNVPDYLVEDPAFGGGADRTYYSETDDGENLVHEGWLARRWDDPAFPRAFPWYNTDRYWSDHILDLREQLAILNEPPLSLR